MVDLLATSITEPFALFLGVIVSAIVLGLPIISFLKKIQTASNAEASKAGAESTLYGHLKDQLELQKKELEHYKDENNRLWEMIRGLEQRLQKIETLERDLSSLKRNLDDKDQQITSLHIIIDQLNQEIVIKNTRIQTLEYQARIQ